MLARRLRLREIRSRESFEQNSSVPFCIHILDVSFRLYTWCNQACSIYDVNQRNFTLFWCGGSMKYCLACEC